MTTQEYQQVLQLIQGLGNSVDSLRQTVDTMVRQGQPQARTAASVAVSMDVEVEKPSKFKGDGSVMQNASNARAFIAAFTTYATSNSRLSPQGARSDAAWIRTLGLRSRARVCRRRFAV